MEKGAAIEKIPQGGNGETVPPKTKRCLTVLSAIRGEGGLNTWVGYERGNTGSGHTTCMEGQYLKKTVSHSLKRV